MRKPIEDVKFLEVELAGTWDPPDMGARTGSQILWKNSNDLKPLSKPLGYVFLNVPNNITNPVLRKLRSRSRNS